MGKAYITSRPLGGACGVGHQFYNWVTAWILANKYDLKFAHAPFCGNEILPQIDVLGKEWEPLLNFGDGEICEKDLSSNIPRIKLPRILSQGKFQVGYDIHSERQEWRNVIERYRDKEVLLECAKNQFITLDWQNLQIEKLQSKYWKARPQKTDAMPTLFDDNSLNVAVHIRRGDVTENGRYKIRWVSNNVYKIIMDQIRQKIQDRQIMFHIFTDASSTNEFGQLEGKDTRFHLWGTNTLNVFHHMALADILITGQSTFSCLAACLCRGIKLVKPWGPLWYNFPKDKNFIEISDDGNFDMEVLSNAMA